MSDGIITFEGVQPAVGNDVYIAPGARVIGHVDLGDEVSVWYNTVIRGDVNDIRIGARTNIQDLTMIHVDSGGFPTHIGEGVTVGHKAIIHGATVGDNCLIGMGATLLNGAVVEDDAMVAAGALVTPGTTIPSGTLAMGSPAKPRRELSAEEIEAFRESAAHYIETARRHRDS
jgi:carbonic anhydrase/acetyltransferase-like protein (isoleucine patch superfamily)